MNRRTHVTSARLMLTALAAALVVSSCANQPDDVSIGRSAASALPGKAAPGEETGLPAHGAPKVSSSLEATRWERSPCDLLSSRELAKVGFDPYRTTPTGNDGGPGCIYSELSIIEVRTTVFTQIPGGLTRLYSERDQFHLFKPIDPLRNHPAVIADVDDQRNHGRCAVFVGLSDDQAFRVIVEADPKTRQGKNPCSFATDLTVLALETMQKAKP